MVTLQGCFFCLFFWRCRGKCIKSKLLLGARLKTGGFDQLPDAPERLCAAGAKSASKLKTHVCPYHLSTLNTPS